MWVQGTALGSFPCETEPIGNLRDLEFAERTVNLTCPGLCHLETLGRKVGEPSRVAAH